MQLAADINWVVDNVRWDLEDDLARVIGDAPARTLAAGAERAAAALRRFVGARGAPGAADRSPP